MKRNDRTIALQDLVDGFLFSLKAEGKAGRTIQYYEDHLRLFLVYAQRSGWLNDSRLLGSREIREFLLWVGARTYEYSAGNGTHLARKAKPSTAWPYYRALRRLFNWAMEESYLKSSPLSTIHFKSPSAPPVQPYSREELKRLLAVCDLDIRTGARFTGLRNKSMLLLFVDTGLRRVEMVNLQLGDLDLERKQARVLGKGGKIGIVPFSSRTAKALWRYLIERKPRAKADALWLTEEGVPFSVDGLVSWFSRLKKRAGVTSPGGVHRLRHTAALQYLRKTRDPFLLQLFLRHESLEMSRRYTQGLKVEEAIAAHRNGASPVEGLGLG